VAGKNRKKTLYGKLVLAVTDKKTAVFIVVLNWVAWIPIDVVVLLKYLYPYSSQIDSMRFATVIFLRSIWLPVIGIDLVYIACIYSIMKMSLGKKIVVGTCLLVFFLFQLKILKAMGIFFLL
jgi:hypothetical protein